jgi:hypothetical protein
MFFNLKTTKEVSLGRIKVKPCIFSQEYLQGGSSLKGIARR